MNAIRALVATYWWFWLITLVCTFGYSITSGPPLVKLIKEKTPQVRKLSLSEVRRLAKEDAIQEAKHTKPTWTGFFVSRIYLMSLILFPVSLLLLALGY